MKEKQTLKIEEPKAVKKMDLYAEKDTLIFFCASSLLFFILMNMMFSNLSRVTEYFAIATTLSTIVFLWLHKTREGIHPVIDVLIFVLPICAVALLSGATLLAVVVIAVITAIYLIGALRLHNMFFRMHKKQQGSEVWDFLIDLNLGKQRLETGQGSYLPEEFNHIVTGLQKSLNQNLWHDYRREREMCYRYALDNQFAVDFSESPGEDYLKTEDGKHYQGDFKATKVPFMAALTALKIFSYFLNDKAVPIKIKFIRRASKELAEAKDGNYIITISVPEKGLMLKDNSKLSKKSFNTQIEEFMSQYRKKGNVKVIQFMFNESGMYQFYIQYSLPNNT